MSINFRTDDEHKCDGSHNYRITVETDIKRYFEAVQQTARECVDDSTKTNNKDSNVVTPQVAAVKTSGSTKVYYVCSWCECDLTPDTRGFFVYCPRCGKRIDYSNHQFLKESLNAIR